MWLHSKLNITNIFFSIATVSSSKIFYSDYKQYIFPYHRKCRKDDADTKSFTSTISVPNRSKDHLKVLSQQVHYWLSMNNNKSTTISTCKVDHLQSTLLKELMSNTEKKQIVKIIHV